MASAALAEHRTNPAKHAIPLRDRLIVALDLPSVDAARGLVHTLGDAVSFYKIGMQLQYADDGAGLRYARELIDQGKKIFLDSKMFDIGETIERGVENVAKMGVEFLTVHGNGPTIQAAVRGRGDSALQILSVTVLTSLDAADLEDLGFHNVGVEQLVLHRARKAFEAGADGVIASGQEAAAICQLSEGKLKIITPGIRRASDHRGDQKRVVTPHDAITSGADYLVVGRPISQAPDPRAEAEAILGDIGEALAAKSGT